MLLQGAFWSHRARSTDRFFGWYENCSVSETESAVSEVEIIAEIYKRAYTDIRRSRFRPSAEGCCRTAGNCRSDQLRTSTRVRKYSVARPPTFSEHSAALTTQSRRCRGRSAGSNAIGLEAYWPVRWTCSDVHLAYNDCDQRRPHADTSPCSTPGRGHRRSTKRRPVEHFGIAAGSESHSGTNSGTKRVA